MQMLKHLPFVYNERDLRGFIHVKDVWSDDAYTVKVRVPSLGRKPSSVDACEGR